MTSDDSIWRYLSPKSKVACLAVWAFGCFPRHDSEHKWTNLEKVGLIMILNTSNVDNMIGLISAKYV
jgi:hypothetical protein